MQVYPRHRLVLAKAVQKTLKFLHVAVSSTDDYLHGGTSLCYGVASVVPFTDSWRPLGHNWATQYAMHFK